MSTIKNRGNRQNHVEEMADEALDLDHNNTTRASHVLASAGVSNANNSTNRKSLSDDRAHTQVKDDSINQHMIYRGATGDHLCLECNEIKEIFDFEASIPVRSWRTLDLLAHIDRSDRVTKGLWELKKNMDKACSFCSFLMNCASRMATHTTVDLNSENWFLALGVRTSAFVAGNASGERPANLLSTQVLELCLRKMPYHQDPFMIQWKDVYLILPAQAYNDGHDEITDTIDWELIHKWLGTCHSEHANCRTDLAVKKDNCKNDFLILLKLLI